VVAFLLGGDGASRWYWTTPALFLAYAALWLVRRRSPGMRLNRLAARAVYLVAGLTAGVVYELGLTVDGTGVGGMHRDTSTSFLLLPGYLVPAVGFTLLAVARYGLDARRAFFVAGGMCWMEALTVGGASMLAAPWFAPLIVALYVASYAVYTGALGLLLIEPRSLWLAHPRPAGRAWLTAYSVVTGGLAWLCFGAWSLVVPGAW
jgi:hypothetical protein